MHETIYKQAVMDSLSPDKGSDDTVQITETEETTEPEEETTESTEETAEPLEESTEPTEETTEDVTDGDTDAVDVSDGDTEKDGVSSGDISDGDVSKGDISSGDTTPPPDTNDTLVTYSTCLYEPKPNLWESDIADYDTTDGLLLLILIFTAVNTAFNVFKRRG